MRDKNKREPRQSQPQQHPEADINAAQTLLQDPNQVAPVEPQAFGQRLAEIVTRAVKRSAPRTKRGTGR